MWEVGAGAGSAQKEGFAAVSGTLRSSGALRETGLGDEICRGVGKAECLGCVRRAVLCKAFPCGERVCSV